MTDRRTRKHDLRCFCSRKPLLAMYGLDRKGRLFVHIKVFKQNRVYGEMLVHGGEVKIRCRECLRWHNITILSPDSSRAILRETQTPVEVDGPDNVVSVATQEGGESK